MKYVNFDTVKIKNFLSIGNEEVEVDFKHGLNIITGINKDKQDRRNGVGKSTIADAIHFAIFGNTIRELKKENIVEFVAHPAKRSEIFRIVARRCGVQTRVHPRFKASIEVHRADGVLVGKTHNLSREGMLMRTVHPAAVNQSLFVKLSLPGEELRLRCRILDAEPTTGGGSIARAMFEQVRGPERLALFRFIDQLDQQGLELS